MTTSVTVFLAPAPINCTQFIPGTNQPASGGKLFSYSAGTSQKSNTYTTSSGSVANSNPIILDSGGNVSASHEVWLQGGISYDFVLAPSTDTDPPVSPYWTAASLTGINDPTSVLNEWVPSGSTATFVNASTMTFVGDVTSILSNQRRLKTINTGGTLFSTITSSVFSVSTTTLGIASDSTGIDSGLSAVSYGLIAPTSNSLPRGVYNVSSLIATGNVSSATVSTGTLNLQGGSAASVAAAPLVLVNDRIVTWFGSSGTFADSGFIWYGTGNQLMFGTNNGTKATLSSSGTLTLTTDSPFILTGQTITAGASTATLTNSPHAGNPTAWPRININGSTLCFPCFATT